MNKLIEYNHYISVNSEQWLTPPRIAYLRKERWTIKKIANFVNKSERTIYRWNKPKPTDKEDKPKRGRKLKITGNILKLLLSYDENNNAATFREISDYLYQKTGQKFSQATIFRVLKKHDITWKKAEKQYSEQDEKEVRRFIEENRRLLSLPSFYAIDESGFNLGAVPFYARAPKGQRAVIKRPGKRGSNYTLTLCVQNVKEQAVIRYKLIKGGSKTKDFHKFLRNIKFPTKGKQYILLDNARIHHATDSCKKLKLSTIQELATKRNAELKFLLGYSPKLNPVEKCFSNIKSYYRKQRPRTERKLRQVIKEAITELQKQDLTKYFRSCFDL